MSENLNLDELEAIGKRATAGPVERFGYIGHSGGLRRVRVKTSAYGSRGAEIAQFESSVDAGFYVAARNNWQPLIDRVRELERERKKLKSENERLRSRLRDTPGPSWDRIEQ